MTRSRDSVPARTVGLFFLAAAALLASASPLWMSGMGYAGEEMNACRQILDGRSITWPRNGAVSLALELPLAAAARVLGARTPAGEERLAALAPVLATAVIAALVYAWASRLARSRSWGLAIALAATFATMLWPYAYMGMEPLQSLLLLAAGWCALEAPPAPASWPRAIAFGLLAGGALSAKSTGFLLLPAVAYLAWRLLGAERRAPTARVGASLAIAAAIFALNTASRLTWWRSVGGTAGYGRSWLVHDAVSPFLTLAALLASPNKGLLVFAPLAVVGLFALPAAWRRERPVAVFALWTLGGIAGGISILGIWSDETWGPRYLHAAIAPLALCFAASRAGRDVRLRSEVPFAVGAAAGLVVSALGVLFYYGSLMGAANATTTLTLESLQGDATWNHPRFNARLLTVWLRDTAHPVTIRPERIWNFEDPSRPQVWRAFDIRPMATPQPLVLRIARTRSERILRWLCLLSALAGILLLEATRRTALGDIIPRDP